MCQIVCTRYKGRPRLCFAVLNALSCSACLNRCISWLLRGVNPAVGSPHLLHLELGRILRLLRSLRLAVWWPGAHTAQILNPTLNMSRHSSQTPSKRSRQYCLYILKAVLSKDLEGLAELHIRIQVAGRQSVLWTPHPSEASCDQRC